MVLVLAVSWRVWHSGGAQLPVGSLSGSSTPATESAGLQALRAQMAQQRQQVEEHQSLLLHQQSDARRHEHQLLTPECRFWWLQNDERPSERTRQKKLQYCET